MARQIRPFTGPDGTNWGVEVQVPGASNAMIVFHHPGGKTARLDRYAWDIWSGPESRSVTSRVSKDKVMQALTDEKLRLLFRRSMPVSNTLRASTEHLRPLSVSRVVSRRGVLSRATLAWSEPLTALPRSARSRVSFARSLWKAAARTPRLLPACIAADHGRAAPHVRRDTWAREKTIEVASRRSRPREYVVSLRRPWDRTARRPRAHRARR